MKVNIANKFETRKKNFEMKSILYIKQNLKSET
jgi:hypothetical protein